MTQVVFSTLCMALLACHWFGRIWSYEHGL